MRRATHVSPSRLSPGRWLAETARWAAFGACAVSLLLIPESAVLGFRAAVDMSDSMRPAIRAGDVVISQTASAASLRLGDVVTFSAPRSHEALVTHRVVALSVSGTVVHVVTRGDANTGLERWSIPTRGTLGLVRLRLPKVGYALAWLRSGPARLLLFAVPVCALVCLELFAIWRPHRGAVGRAVEI